MVMRRDDDNDNGQQNETLINIYSYLRPMNIQKRKAFYDASAKERRKRKKG